MVMRWTRFVLLVCVGVAVQKPPPTPRSTCGSHANASQEEGPEPQVPPEALVEALSDIQLAQEHVGASSSSTAAPASTNSAASSAQEHRPDLIAFIAEACSQHEAHARDILDSVDLIPECFKTDSWQGVYQQLQQVVEHTRVPGSGGTPVCVATMYEILERIISNSPASEEDFEILMEFRSSIYDMFEDAIGTRHETHLEQAEWEAEHLHVWRQCFQGAMEEQDDYLAGLWEICRSLDIIWEQHLLQLLPLLLMSACLATAGPCRSDRLESLDVSEGESTVRPPGSDACREEQRCSWKGVAASSSTSENTECPEPQVSPEPSVDGSPEGFKSDSWKLPKGEYQRLQRAAQAETSSTAVCCLSDSLEGPGDSDDEPIVGLRSDAYREKQKLPDEELRRVHAASNKHGMPGHQCKPCHFPPGQCWQGNDCPYCHICDKPKRKSKTQRMVEKRRQVRYKIIESTGNQLALDAVKTVDEARRKFLTGSESLKQDLKDKLSGGTEKDRDDAQEKLRRLGELMLQLEELVPARPDPKESDFK